MNLNVQMEFKFDICVHVCSGVAKPRPTRALARTSAYLALASKADKNHVISW